MKMVFTSKTLTLLKLDKSLSPFLTNTQSLATRDYQEDFILLIIMIFVTISNLISGQEDISFLTLKYLTQWLKFRMYNWHDFGEMLHGNGYPDMDLDHQLADPMNSNHYIQNRSILFAWFMAGVMFLFVVSKEILNLSLSHLWLRYLWRIWRSYQIQKSFLPPFSRFVV